MKSRQSLQYPHALVTITGPTEAAVMRRAADWLEDLDNAVVVVSTHWRGDVSELTGSDPDKSSEYGFGSVRQ